MDMSLAGKTIFISGGSRGIGLAIALRAARDGAKIALAAKAAEPHAKLEGTQLLKDERGGVAERIEQKAGIL
jgi:NAD(P)-dependent dehydrogenase (short-subunit alcohol dehydrogenase family)